MAQTSGTGVAPRLRFPEFRMAECWDTTTLGAVATILKGRGIAKSDVVTDGALPCIRYGELYTRYGEVIDAVHSRTNVPESELFLSRRHDVLIPASGETKLDIATAACVIHEGVALGSDLNVLRTNQNGVFLSYLLNSSKRKEIARVAQGDTVVHLYPSQLQNINVPLPEFREQSKIADCLASLDAVIAAQARKVEALKAHKRGLMQQLFPREGETVPRLRFPEFRGEWEECALGTLCESVASGRDKADPNGPFDLYGSTGVIGKTGTAPYNGRYVLVARVGANAGLLTAARGQFGVTDNTIVIAPMDASSTDFFYFYLQSIGLNRMIYGSGQPLITGTQLKNLALYLPDVTEQQRVAGVLTSLDARVRAESEDLTSLRSHKTGLMQQLFPSPAAAE